ncbi:AraC family transcriptional regulator [Sphingobacterium puteale]|uniref:AraC family transcriptional regulator n=1 Tax=Sphingobacterium puteale TaxID=2420510 RepID=A0A420VT09_9SPHI|nr:helix-turn-helix domain-containing protein [Sphingobacterium puteale]RKO69415.1 AraC family transcriptional regulator [Sphingobacterium puteale]
MEEGLYYKIIKPDDPLSNFVDSFWCLYNHSDEVKETIGLPDGRVDLFLFCSPADGFRILLLGLGTQPHEQASIPVDCVMFCISLKLLAVEYILQESIADIINSGKLLKEDFWGFSEQDLQNFDRFIEKSTQLLLSVLPTVIDKRKQKLFDLIYKSKGSVTVSELSEKVCWTSRQINRYFNQWFGLSLKAYSNILRFRASLDHIAQGKLFPEEHFFDQNHFIKEIKKFAGVVPKELLKNKNDRFILLSSLTSK